jgi:hypothetical protein
MELLRDAEPESAVLFLDMYADSDEAVEIEEVFLPTAMWTHERGRYAGKTYAAHYPGGPAHRQQGFEDVAYQTSHVVVLSQEPTNLRFDSHARQK